MKSKNKCQNNITFSRNITFSNRTHHGALSSTRSVTNIYTHNLQQKTTCFESHVAGRQPITSKLYMQMGSAIHFLAPEFF